MTPTDDDLLAVLPEARLEGLHGVVPDLASLLRTAVESATRADAERFLAMVLDHPNVPKLARALRARFPQPITGEVLTAAGFAPDGNRWLLMLAGNIRVRFCTDTRDGSQRVLWGKGRRARTHRGSRAVRTPDRLHEVVEALRKLYGEPEGGET